jgi:hypothetical protein
MDTTTHRNNLPHSPLPHSALKHLGFIMLGEKHPCRQLVTILRIRDFILDHRTHYKKREYIIFKTAL